jgi:hypothetical protein
MSHEKKPTTIIPMPNKATKTDPIIEVLDLGMRIRSDKPKERIINPEGMNPK